MKRVLLLGAVLCAFASHAQLNESFTDGDFTANPTWSGTANWQIVANSDVAAGATGSNTLRLNESGAGTNYLSTQITGGWNNSQSWVFWLGRRSQAATDANRIYVWLYANEANVTSATVDGYRIRFGDDSGGDNVILERVTNGVGTAIITSVETTANGIEDFGFMVRVVRSSTGAWSLYTSTLPQTNGTGATATTSPIPASASILQGSTTDNTYSSFTDGYVAFHTINSSGVNARTAVEFDQLRVLFFSEATLPVKFDNLKATQSARGVNLQWSNMTESDVVEYSLERSSNGRNFSSVAQFNPVSNNGGKADYQYLDASPLSGTNFYRIKATETNGKVVYSDVARINIGGRNTALNLYPNPVKGNFIGLQVDNLPAGKYFIKIYNSSAQVVNNQSLDHEGGSVSQTVSLNNLKPGIYTFEINGALKLQKQFIVQ
jgi:hypothetical protein